MPRDIEALRAFLKTRYREDKYIERLFYPESPLPLEDCYLSLALVTEEEVRKAKGLQAGEADSGEGAAAVEAGTQERQHCLHEYDRIQHIQKKLDVNAILGECQHTPGRIPRRIYIEGAAGAGKSTLSRFLAHEWGCDKAPWSGEYDWVFHLRLRDLTLDKYAQEKDLFDILDGELFVGDGSHLTPEELTVFQGDVREHPSKVLWILDGYDEVNPGILGSRWWRGLLASQYHLLITSRPGTALVKREVGINLELAVLGLSDDQVKEYIQNFFDPIHTPDAKPSDAKVCFDFLKAQVELWSLAHTPILLEILCSSWQELRAQPILTLTHLYEVVVERLLKRRARAEGIAAEALSREFLETRYKSYLSYMEHLAFLGMLSRSPIIQKENIEESFKALPSELKQDKDFYKNLRDLGVVKRYNDGLRAEFAHLTFQEFFAARYVAKSIIAFSEKKKRVGYLTDEALLKFFKQNKWHGFYEMMWWFVAGLLRDGTNQSVLEKYAYHGGDRNHTELGELPHSHRCLQATQVFFDLLLQEPRAELEVFELPLLAKCLVEAGMPNVMQREAIKLHFIKWLEFFIKRRIAVKSDILQKLFMTVKANKEILTWIEDFLLSLLKNVDSDSRAVAAEAIGRIGTSATEALQLGLLPLLNVEDLRVSFNLVEALKAIGASVSEVFQSRLLAILSDPGAGHYVRKAAAEAVGWVGAGACKDFQLGLLPLLRNPEWRVRGGVAWAVGQIGAAAPEDLQLGLLPLLRDSDKGVRSAAAEAVGKIGVTACEALQLGLLPFLSDPDLWVRNRTAWIIRGFGAAASVTLQSALLALLCDKNKDVRADAFWAIGVLGAAASEALQLRLLPLLSDPDKGVRNAAAEALGQVDPSATEALQLGLLPLLESSDKDVRKVAAKVVGGIGAAACEALQLALLPLLRDSDKGVRSTASQAIRGIGAGACEALQLGLLSLLTDQDERVRMFAAEAVGHTNASALEVLKEKLLPLLDDPAEWVRQSAVMTVGRIGLASDEEVQLALLALLGDSNWNIRKFAAIAIAGIESGGVPTCVQQSESVQKELLFLLKSRDWEVRCTAVLAVQLIGFSARPDFQLALLPLLSDSRQGMRDAAEDAVRRIGPAACEDFQLGLLPLLDSRLGNSVISTAIGALSETRFGLVLLCNKLFSNRPKHVPPCQLIVSSADRVGTDEQGRLGCLKLCGEMLQSVLSDGNIYPLTEDSWTIAIVRKNEAPDAQRPRSSVSFFGSARDLMSHAFLVIEGVRDQVRFAYKIDLYAVGGNGSSQSSGQNIKIEITEIDDFRRFQELSQRSCCMMHGIDSGAAERLLEIIRADKAKAERGEIIYSMIGDGSVSQRTNGKLVHSCISWCLEKWQEAGLPLKRKWYDTVVVLPTAYLPDLQEQAKKDDCLMM